MTPMRRFGGNTNLVRTGDPPVSLGSLVFEQTFSATLDHKNSTLQELLAALGAAGLFFGEDDASGVHLVLDEALINAVTHGSQSDPAKSIRVRAFSSAEKWSVLVEDQGNGFREEDLPDPLAPENLHAESGRGILLIRKMMSEATYYRGGSALLISRRR